MGKHYFQAVTNSSWANYDYLVVAEISGKEILQELRILAGLHSIRVIHGQVDDPSDSFLAIPVQKTNY